ncbi:hypothetical protein F2Q68_00035513 [Brassica cretica]|uniref:Uncharacterized protein n=1 Tax=Brassica cretica TaxID=69181 RepID=A0A8S9H7K2_BRACR|nr:hypothetical protein F2Q68_00035513 [Brassica cretica]
MDLHGPQWSRTRKRIERAAARLLGSHGGGSDGKRNSNPCRLLQSHSNLSQNRFSNARQSNHYRKKIFGPLWSTFGRLLSGFSSGFDFSSLLFQFRSPH